MALQEGCHHFLTNFSNKNHTADFVNFIETTKTHEIFYDNEPPVSKRLLE